MNMYFKQATSEHASTIGAMVVDLTREICALTGIQHFDINLQQTIEQCESLLKEGHYSAILGLIGDKIIAVVTMSETYALYASGKIAVVQEFYVDPEYRETGVGSLMVEQAKAHAKMQGSTCIELCTPPLPEFARSVSFYQKNGLSPVGGRKMRVTL